MPHYYAQLSYDLCQVSFHAFLCGKLINFCQKRQKKCWWQKCQKFFCKFLRTKMLMSTASEEKFRRLELTSLTEWVRAHTYFLGNIFCDIVDELDKMTMGLYLLLYVFLGCVFFLGSLCTARKVRPYMYVCEGMFACISVHIYACMYVYMCVRMSLYEYVYVYLCLRMSLHQFVCTHACISVLISISTFLYVYSYMYAYT